MTVASLDLKVPNFITLNPLSKVEIFQSATSQVQAQFFTVNIQDGANKENFADTKLSAYVWTGKFDLNLDTCGTGNFCIRKDKVADSKISG